MDTRLSHDLHLAAAALVAIAISAWPLVAAAGEPDDVSALVTLALANNPELEAMNAQIDALEEKVARVSAWTDPKLMIAYQNAPIDSFAMGREPMTMVTLRLEQTVPLFGKTDKREEVVRAEASSKRWELKERRTQLRAMVLRIYYNLALTRQLKKITQDHLDLLAQLLETVRIKYEVGRAEQHNLLRLETLKARLADDLLEFDRQDVELTAALNTTLHRDLATPVITPEALLLAPPTQSVTELKKMALEHRPALKQLAATATMNRLSANLARAESAPDLTFFVGYGLRTDLPGDNPGRDLVTLGVSMPLSLLHKSPYRAQARESLSRARASDLQRESLSDTIGGSIAESLATWKRAAQKVQTYANTLVPKARQTLDATYASYQVDRSDFLSLYDAQLELLNFERTIRTTLVEGLIARTTIEMVIGKEPQ